MKNSQSLRFEMALAPQASATTARSAAVDCAGADYVTVLVPVSAEANTNSTNVILDVLNSDTDAATAYVSLGTVLIDNTAANVGAYHVNMVGKKRYMKVTVTPDTTTNGAVLVGGITFAKQVKVAPNAATTSTVEVEA